MSKMSELYGDLELIRSVMEPGQSAEEQIERRLDFVIRELDEMCAFANNPETVDMIEREALAIGQILSRAQLIAGFLNARKSQPVVVSFRR